MIMKDGVYDVMLTTPSSSATTAAHEDINSPASKSHPKRVWSVVRSSSLEAWKHTCPGDDAVGERRGGGGEVPGLCC